jgi:hypothetical protein
MARLIKVDVIPTPLIDIEVISPQIIDVDVGTAVIPYPLKEYEGEYTVTPKTTEQTLETAGLKMVDNVTVFSIPYYATSNPEGGYTITIAD